MGSFFTSGAMLFGLLISMPTQARTCAQLFVSETAVSQPSSLVVEKVKPQVPNLSILGGGLRGPSIREKFVNKDMERLFYRIIDQSFSHETMIWLDTEVMEDREEIEAALFYQGLMAGGLDLAAAPGDRGPTQLLLQGSIDLLLPALRHPAVRMIGLTEDLTQPHRVWPFFSQVRPAASVPERHHAQEKFQSLNFYYRFRQALLGAPGETFEIAIRVADLEEGGDTQFIRDVHKLGLIVESVNLRSVRRVLKVEGPIDAIFMLIRHPGTLEVLRFEETASIVKQHEVREEEEKRRIKVREDLTKRDAPRQIAVVGENPLMHKIVAYRDAETPSLIHIGAPQDQRSRIAHEMQTARDYAKFLSKHYGLEFGYAFEYNGKSVPLFDGVVLDSKLHRPLSNVSLKFATEPIEQASMQLIRDAIADRVTKHIEKAHILSNANEWFKAANNGQIIDKTGDAPKEFYDYTRRIQHARTLMNLFGVHFDETKQRRRDTQIVIDYRDFPMLFDFFQVEWASKMVSKILKEFATPDLSVTLLWSDTKVIEFDRDSVRIYQ